MHNKQPDVDIIHDILIAMLRAKPESVFINSLYNQYCERGGLSKKQLEGLHSKATKVNTIPFNKLATLEAIIKKRPTRHKSTITQISSLPAKDEELGKKMDSILLKYPQHKRVLYLKARYNNNELITATDSAEIDKFYKLLIK